MENVYPLLIHEGVYDTRTTRVVSVFRDKEMAKNEAKRLNNEMEELKKKVDNVFFNEDKNRNTIGAFGDFINNELILLILKDEYPEYYNFYFMTDCLFDVFDDDNKRELASEIGKLLNNNYINDIDKLCRYATKLYDEETADKVKLYFEYKNNCTDGNFYNGLPSYYASETSIPVY